MGWGRRKYSSTSSILLPHERLCVSLVRQVLYHSGILFCHAQPLPVCLAVKCFSMQVQHDVLVFQRFRSSKTSSSSFEEKRKWGMCWLFVTLVSFPPVISPTCTVAIVELNPGRSTQGWIQLFPLRLFLQRSWHQPFTQTPVLLLKISPAVAHVYSAYYLP